MIGIIIVGHGKFGLGLTSSLTMIAGEPQEYFALEFTDEMPLDELSTKIEAAINELDHDKGIVVLTDLLGGTPFKTAMLLKEKYQNLAILTGTNLPMLIELNLMRQFSEDVFELAKKIEATGRQQVQYIEEISVKEDVEDDEEGI